METGLLVRRAFVHPPPVLGRILSAALLVSVAVATWVLFPRLGLVRSRPRLVLVAASDPGQRRPVVVLTEGSGFGPWVRVFAYEDGGVIVERSDRTPMRVEGSLGHDAVKALARRVSQAIGRPEWRRELRGEDGPSAEILARVDDVWTVDRANGMFPGVALRRSLLTGRDDDGTDHPWSSFFDVMTELTMLDLRDVHPWVPETVALCLRPADHGTTALPWPDTLPEPPVDLLSRSPRPCFDAPGRYESAALARARAPGAWAVALGGEKWQLVVEVVLPGERTVASVRGGGD